MSNRYPFILIALLSLTGLACGAEPVLAFSYEGLQAVKPELVDRVTSRYIGENADGDTEERLTADLRDLELFSAVGVSWSETGDGNDRGAIGIISLEERNTFIAVPMGGTRDGEFSLGAAVIETNLFGMGKKIAAAGRVGKESWSASVRYTDPFAAEGAGLLTLGAGYSSGTVNKTDAEGNTLYRFESADIRLGTTAGLYLGDETTVSLGAGFISGNAARVGDYAVPQESVAAPYASFSVERSRPVWDGTFNSGTSISSETGLYFTADPTAWVSADLALRYPLYPGLRFAVAASGYLLTRDDALLDPGAKETQSFLMPASYFAPRTACAATEVEFAFLETRAGTISVFAGGEAAAGAGGRSGTGFWYGPKGGLRLYFKKVPLPGAALTAGYDLARTGLSIGLSLGIRF